MNVIAVDPGGTAGIAVYRDGEFESFQAPGFWGVVEFLDDCAPPDVLVAEKFTIRANTHKLDAVAFEETTDTLGYLRYWTKEGTPGAEFVRQTPGEAKAFATDDKLKRLGWWNSTPGGHANDASRHLLTFLAKRKYRPILERLVP